MSIAIVGGSGFLGRNIALRLLAHGEKPLVIHRGNEAPHLPETVQIALADREDEEALVSIFRRHHVKLVIDIYALSLENTKAVISAAQRIGARYVLTSSVDVYSNYEGLLKKGSPEINPFPATETSPLRTMRYPYRGNSRRPQGVREDLFENYDKIVIEDDIRARDMDFVILRPPMIYGIADKQRRFGWVFDNAKGDSFAIDERAASWLNSYAYVEDIAEAFVIAGLHPDASGKTYNVGTPIVRSATQWAQLLLPLLGVKAEVTAAPAGQGVYADRADAMDLRYPLTLDPRAIRDDLGFKEVIGEAEALAKTLRSYGSRAD